MMLVRKTPRKTGEEIARDSIRYQAKAVLIQLSTKITNKTTRLRFRPA